MSNKILIVCEKSKVVFTVQFLGIGPKYFSCVSRSSTVDAEDIDILTARNKYSFTRKEGRLCLAVSGIAGYLSTLNTTTLDHENA